MDPAVAAALVAGGWTAIATVGTQFLAGRREAARERLQAERDEGSQRWETNRERLIELRALLDGSAVKLMAYEKAVEELRTAVALYQQIQIKVPSAKQDRVTSLDHEIDELEGRLALRVGTTHPVTRSFTLACNSLSDCQMRLTGVLVEASIASDADVSRDPARESKLADTLDKSQSDARTYRHQFFNYARELVGVEGPLRDASADAKRLPPGEDQT
jgi:hypothetical protein